MTPADVTERAVEELLSKAYTKLKALGGWGQSPEFEIYLDPAPSGQESGVDYYFINQQGRHPFWPESVDTRDLGLSPYDTMTFLGGLSGRLFLPSASL